MNINSLGYKSELIFTSFDGKVEQRDNYVVVRTLTTPNYFWGNLLIFNRPPVIGDYENWIKLFKNEFKDPRIYHITVAWDTPNGLVGNVSEFTNNGFELEGNAVLTAQSVIRPPKFNDHMLVRPLQTEKEWDQMIDLQVNSAHDYLPREEWINFYSSQSNRYRGMSSAGFGNWYGGFLEGKLVAGLGIFHKNGLGRFQIVCTHPEYRRKGLCGTLVYQSSIHAFEKCGVKDLVMCADPDYYAIKIYESVGFKKQNLDYGLCWWDRNHSQDFDNAIK